MRRLITALLPALLALLALPASALAGFFPAEVVDGPNADLVSVGDVDVSRDGTGAAVFVRRDGGVPHVFLSRLSGGALAAGTRVDPALGGASGEPVIGVADGGRMAIAFVNDGSLYTSVQRRGQKTFSAPALVAQGGVSSPSVDMSINGVTYVSWTQNGDVRAARAGRDSADFAVLPGALDVDPAAEAGTGDRLRSRVAVSAEGSGLVAWGERGADGRTHVFARRVFEGRLSAFPQDLTLSSFDGRAALDADTPELDIEDDASFAQVIFRQVVAGGERVVMRRMRGTQFDDAVAADGGQGGTRGRIDLSGRGEGLFASSGNGAPAVGGTLWNQEMRLVQRLDSGTAVPPSTTPAIGENEDGALTWIQGGGPGDAVVRARYLNDIERARAEADATLTRPEFGPVAVDGGLDAAATRLGDVVVVFLQNGGDGRRLAAAYYDKPPSRPVGTTGTLPRRLTELKWAAARDLLGSPRYRVLVDGRRIGETRSTTLRVARGRVRRGTHRWQVIAIDRRGQQARSRTRTLRVSR
jgi:hypothetical protein